MENEFDAVAVGTDRNGISRVWGVGSTTAEAIEQAKTAGLEYAQLCPHVGALTYAVTMRMTKAATEGIVQALGELAHGRASIKERVAECQRRAVKTFRVTYRYDGGRGVVDVQAATKEEAITIGMPQARPQYASDPATPCVLSSCFRIMGTTEMLAERNHGLESAIDLTWDRRDKGHRFLVVERGHMLPGLGDVWTTTGRLIGTTTTRAGGMRLASAARAKTRAQYDVVERHEITLSESAAAYGVNAGEVTY